MELAAIRPVVPPPSAGGVAVDAAALPPGVSIQATVREMLAGGLARLLLPQGTLEVRTPIPLTPGAAVLVTGDGQGGVTLSLPASPGRAPAALAPASTATGPAGSGAAVPSAPSGAAGPSIASAASRPAPDAPTAAASPADSQGRTAPAAAEPAPSARAAALTPGTPVFRAVAQDLQRQAPLQPLLANLAEIVDHRPEMVPRPVLAAAQAVLAARLPAENLSAASLEKAVRDAGLAMDRRLATGTPPAALQGDIKALLTQLKAAIAGVWPETQAEAEAGDAAGRGETERAPPPRRGDPPVPHKAQGPSLPSTLAPADLAARLADQTEAALARLRLAQVASLPGEAGPGEPKAEAARPAPQTLHVEIPLALGRDTTTLSLTVEKEPEERTAPDGPGGALWRLWFALDLGDAGPVTALVTMRAGQGAVAVTLWAERTDTHQTLRAALPALHAELAAADFASVEVAARPGAPKRARPVSGGFLDTRT